MTSTSFLIVGACGGLLLLTGAGCHSSTSTSLPTPGAGTSASSGYPTDPAANPSAQVPNDIPVYPSGHVIMVSGQGTDHVSAAESTPDPAATVSDWIKSTFASHGVLFGAQAQQGNSTTLTFTNATTRYSVRIDAPNGGGGAYLTITKEPIAQP